MYKFLLISHQRNGNYLLKSGFLQERWCIFAGRVGVVGEGLKRRIQNLVKLKKLSFFAKIINGFQLITIFAKESILDI